MYKIKISVISFIVLTVGLYGCRKMVSVDTPVNQLTGDKVFRDSTSTTALLDNTYALFNQTIDQQYTPSIGTYADELNYTGTNTDLLQLFQSTVSPANGTNLNIWTRNYYAIYSCNDLIAGLNNYAGIKPATKSEFICEAKFLRAYAYFYLVNLYGPVPLVLTTDVNTTALAARSDTATVYKQIIQDLTDAQTGLAETYTGDGKVRANKWAATAMLARAYLYQKKYAEAEAASSLVIGSGLYMPLQSPSSVFLAGSRESILQFYTQNGYVNEAATIIPVSGKPTYAITGGFLNAFESGDLRKSAWIDSITVTSGSDSSTFYYPYKYHNRTTNAGTSEYLVALRVAEQYLIRSEARLEQNNIRGAVSDLNVIRQRAGLAALSTAITVTSCMDAIMHERQIELFSEWGNRFLDLKRTGRINAIMGQNKNTWKQTAVALPIPQTELSSDPNLIQNTGY